MSDILTNIFLKDAEVIYNGWLNDFLNEHPLNTEEQFRDIMKVKLASIKKQVAEDIDFKNEEPATAMDIDFTPTREDFISDKHLSKMNLSGMYHTLLALERYITLNPLGNIDAARDFVDYIQTDDDAIKEKILTLVNGAKGAGLAKILYAIHKLGCLPHPTSLNQTHLFDALVRVGAGGERQSLNYGISQINIKYHQYEDDINRIASRI